MKRMPRYGRFVLGTWALSILILAVWMGCDGKRERGPTIAADTTPLPQLDKGCRPGDPPTTREGLDACLKGLDFDEEDLAGDEQRLMVFDSMAGPGCPGARSIHNCRLGPLARIKPEVHSHLWADSTVQQQGRIIAELSLSDTLVLPDKEKKDYPKLALVPHHKTYWWVQLGSDGKGGRSFFISDSVTASGKLLSVGRKLQVDHYRTGSLKHAIARWLWLADDETGKGTCTSGASCK